MDQCNRVVDALFYLIDQRRMNPTLRDLALDGCMMPPPPPPSSSPMPPPGISNDDNGNNIKPTAPFIYAASAAVYALIVILQTVLNKFYVDRRVQRQINREVIQHRNGVATTSNMMRKAPSDGVMRDMEMNNPINNNNGGPQDDHLHFRALATPIINLHRI